MTDKIETVRHIVNEDGKRVDRIEYEFGDDVSEEAKEEVRNHVPKLKGKEEIRRVIESVESQS